MSDVQKNTHENSPVESSSLPNFSIDTNCCRNPACENFGVSEKDIPDRKHGYVYTEVDGKLKFKCNRCKQNREAYSNLSVLEAFHRSLQNSIPYASCPNPECKNHTVNLFEHYHGDLRDKHRKYYRINVEDDTKQRYQARCRSCSKSFPLSQPLRLHTRNRRTWQKDIETFINAVVDGLGPSNVMNQMRVHADLYYSQLRAASNALMNYNNLHLVNLMKKDYPHKPMRIYTDCIVCSIKTHRKDQRHLKMKIIVSSCHHNNRSLILAFHPLFDQNDIDDMVLITDQKLPLHQRRYDYLEHPFNRKDNDPLPLLGVGGYLMDEFYAYMGHFLVLRKLLTKVPLLHFYMDGEKALYNAALLSFSARIKSECCDVVVRKMEKEKSGSKARTSGVLDQRYQFLRNKAVQEYKKANPGSKTPNNQDLQRFLLAEEMKSVNQAIMEKKVGKNRELFPLPLSRIYTTAISQSKKAGNNFWVTHRLPNKYNAESRMLWLTRSMSRSNGDYELDLYLNGLIFYIDNVFSSFRDRSSMAARPRATATGHKSYNRNPELPVNLIKDFTINVAFWNFFLKFRSKKKETIAYVHGLVKKPESPKIKHIFKTRYTFTNAIRMSKWLGT